MPPWIARPTVDLFGAIWHEVREPMSEYMEEEFDRAIGVLRDEPLAPAGAPGGTVVEGPGSPRRPSASMHGLCAWLFGWGCCSRIRISWLRAIYPHDRGVWKMVKNPAWLPLSVAAMFPFFGIAPIYWVITFIMLEKTDEFQLCQFICTFKGLMAFTTGLVGIVTGSVKAAVASDKLLGCVAAGAPGGLEACRPEPFWPGGYWGFDWDMYCWLLEVFTVWAAFALLPFSNDKAVRLHRRKGLNDDSHKHRHSDRSDSEDDDLIPGSSKHKRRAADKEERDVNNSSEDSSGDGELDEESHGRRGQPVKRSGWGAYKRVRRSIVAFHGSIHQGMRAIASNPTVAEALPGVKCHIVMAFILQRALFVVAACVIVGLTVWVIEPPLAELGLSMPFVLAVLLGLVFKDFINLLFKTLAYLAVVFTVAAALFITLAYSLPLGTPFFLSLVFTAGWLLGPLLHVRPERHVKRVAACGRGGQCVAWGCPYLTFPCWLPCCALWCCERWPANPFRRESQRRGGLLRRMFDYELIIATVCAALVAFEGMRMLLRKAPSAEEIRALDLDFYGTAALAWSRLGPLEELQYRAVLNWTRVVYGLLSLPFVIFTLPYMFEALTHSRPTGYDERGRCVRVLSAMAMSKAPPLDYEWSDVWAACTPSCCRAEPPPPPPELGEEEPGAPPRSGKDLWRTVRLRWRMARHASMQFAKSSPSIRFADTDGSSQDLL